MCYIHTHKYIHIYIFIYIFICNKNIKGRRKYKFRVWGLDIDLKWKSLDGLEIVKEKAKRCN